LIAVSSVTPDETNEELEMSDESKYWTAFFAIASVTLMVVIFLIADYWKDHNRKIVELIQEGVDPVAAMCAMQDDYGNNPVCMVLAAKQ
jgi:hypothetical protein